jgi:nitroreductase
LIAQDSDTARTNPGRRRRLPPLPVEWTEPGTSCDDRRPWTVERIRRGLARRRGLVLDRIRDGFLLPIAARSSVFATVYYAAASAAFRREHLGVLRGRLRYRERADDLGKHEYLLRRNVHMLEKGLVMRPRRRVFALEYLNATVLTFGAIRRRYEEDPASVDVAQLRWAHDVLATYFETAGGHPTIEKIRAKWLAIPELAGAELELIAPYRRHLDGPAPVGYEDLLELALQRRSVRWYLPASVPRELIDRAIDVAALSPSACNRQPFEFRVFDDPELVQRVASIPKGTRGFAEGFPAFVVIVGRLAAFFAERDRHLIYIDGGLAAMSFVLALESLGLASCCINWADDAEQERAMARAIGLSPDERVVMCIALGYPDPSAMVPYSQKRPLERLRRYNVT